MSKTTRQMSRAALRAAAKLKKKTEGKGQPFRFRVIGLQVQVQIEVLAPDTGKVRARTLLGNQEGVVTLHLVEEQIDKLGREALMAILGEAGIHPTD